MAFNLQDYETVESRLEKWWKDYPNGRVSTKLEQTTDTRYIVSAELFKTQEDWRPCATGLASESIADRGVNSTSALENCETSAIGRALANCGYAAKGKRASREEMNKVVRLEAVPAFTVENKSNDPVQWMNNGVELPGAPKPPPVCCEAGHVLRTGFSKTTKKPYYGWVCMGQNKDHAVWAKQDAQGNWFFPELVDEEKGGD